tara:strand:- start:67362 stop:68078 length:717 start_codon:yes stop_codon:yes gene_type:complete
MSQPLVSICVPTYHAKGEQERILSRLIISVKEQVYPNIELVISDQDGTPKKEQSILKFLDGKVTLKYLTFKDDSGISAYNTNNALAHATGEYVQILNHDDFFYHENALRDAIPLLQSSGKKWLAATCLHTDDYETYLDRLHTPHWKTEKDMVEGVNSIGCPSVVVFERLLGLKCSEDIVYAMDCDLWIQAFRAAGDPVILPDVAVVIRMWKNQFTNQMNTAKMLEEDKAKMRKKYGHS